MSDDYYAPRWELCSRCIKNPNQDFCNCGQPGTASSGSGSGRVTNSLLILILVLVGAILLAPRAEAGVAYPAPYGVTVKGRTAGAHQRSMIGRVLATCRQMGARPKVRVAAIATITQESTARNLRGGHGTSVGLFQIIDLHGTWSQRHNPEWSARWFCSRAIRVDRQQPRISVARLAQSVQRSAYPSAYAQWAREAQRTTRRTYASLQCGR